MYDIFTAKPTRIRGRALPSGADRAALQHDHERRLAALDRLGAAAEKCGLRADSDRDLSLLAEDEVSLLESSGSEWAGLGEAIRAWRAWLPLRRLEDFGFPAGVENPLEEPNLQLQRIGGGVEAWAFAAREDGSVYKFYLPREEKRIGSVFGFRRSDAAPAQAESALHAEATLGDYRALLEKLLLIHALGGMATEVVAVTPEGIVVAKQTLGDPLPQGDDVSGVLPASLIEIPSRFLRANRDHPGLFFLAAGNGRAERRHDVASPAEPGARAFLVADLHARNFVRDGAGELRVIDIVAAPWPVDVTARDPWMNEWFERVRADPGAGMLRAVDDDEL
jgi:hypothetical protein